MTPEKMAVAIEVVSELGKLAADMPEEKQGAVSMALNLQNAALYMTEFQVHLKRGSEPYDAMLKTIRGELPIGDPHG